MSKHARRLALLALRCCQQCGYKATDDTDWPEGGLCSDCRRFFRQERRRKELKGEAILWARSLWAEDDWLLVDVESTGLGSLAEIIEIALIDRSGQPLVNTRIRAQDPIEASATQIHGITDEDLRDAPLFIEVWVQHLAELLRQGRRLVGYNIYFDERLLAQSYARAGICFPELEVVDVLGAYSEFIGVKHRDGGYRWWSLRDACFQQHIEAGNHNALGDALATLHLLEAMASHDLPSLEPPAWELVERPAHGYRYQAQQAAMVEWTGDIPF